MSEYIEVMALRPDKVVAMVKKKATFFKKGNMPIERPNVKISSDPFNQKPDLSQKTIERKFHNFQISRNSAKNLKEKASFLHQFAQKRSVRTYTGRWLNGFKTTFLTLTLPSSQVHNTAFLQNGIFDELLQVLRQRLGMQNYVWRLEFQANGNAHWHILTDTYVDYFFALKHWNNLLSKHGYVQAYTEKMRGLSWSQYAENYSNGGKVSKDVLFKRYKKGVASGWSSPNSVDTKHLTAKDNVGFYLAKYFSKKEKQAKCNALDTENNSFGLRLCFWSRSLSRCKVVLYHQDYYGFNVFDFLSRTESTVTRWFDYCRVVYFDFVKLPSFQKEVLSRYWRWFCNEISYTPAPV